MPKDEKKPAEDKPAENPKPAFPSNRNIKEGTIPPKPVFTPEGELKRLITEEKGRSGELEVPSITAPFDGGNIIIEGDLKDLEGAKEIIRVTKEEKDISRPSESVD